MKNVNLRKFLQKQAYERITSELAKFKERMLKQTPEKVYEAAYEIDSYVSIYEQLVSKIDKFSETQLRKFLQLPDVLGLFYSCWLDMEDSREEELSSAVDTVIEKELNSNTIVGILIRGKKKGA